MLTARRGLPFAVSFCLLAHASWAKDTVGGKVAISGEAQAVCAFTTSPSASAASNMQLSSATTNASTVLINQLIEPSTARLNPAAITLTIKATCNAAHQVRFSSMRGRLARDEQSAVVSGVFLDGINYKASLSWATRELSIQADGSPNLGSATEDSAANTGDLIVVVTVDGTDNDFSLPLQAGGYSDTLLIGLFPRL
jgi:hypothetical protein